MTQAHDATTQVKTEHSNFSRTDHAPDPMVLVRMMDAMNGVAFIQGLKERSRAMLATAGTTLLDVGCGTGEDVRALARLVGAGARVVGVDNSQVMLDVARERAASEGVDVEFELADASASLPFEEGTFDGARIERVLMHQKDPLAMLREVARVVKPGGMVIAHDYDLDTIMLHSRHKDITQRAMRFLGGSIAHGWVGRQLPAMFREVGLTGNFTLTPEVLTFPTLAQANMILRLEGILGAMKANGLMTEDEADMLLTDVRTQEEAGTFFFGVVSFTAVGTKQA